MEFRKGLTFGFCGSHVHSLRKGFAVEKVNVGTYDICMCVAALQTRKEEHMVNKKIEIMQ